LKFDFEHEHEPEPVELKYLSFFLGEAETKGSPAKEPKLDQPYASLGNDVCIDHL
jgi:hypothetical protein